MNTHARTQDVFDPRGGAATARPAGLVQRLAGRISDWYRACADYYAAAALYEQLSRLSDAELHRRGLDRGALAREVCERSERSVR
jgi:hypothetical protein